MASKLIQLEDGTLIEVEVPGDQVEEISGGYAKKVEASLDKIRPLLRSICRPFTETWKELNKEVRIEQAEVEIGLNFEGEGNLYITKAKTGANITVKLVMKPKT